MAPAVVAAASGANSSVFQVKTCHDRGLVGWQSALERCRRSDSSVTRQRVCAAAMALPLLDGPAGRRRDPLLWRPSASQVRVAAAREEAARAREAERVRRERQRAAERAAEEGRQEAQRREMELDAEELMHSGGNFRSFRGGRQVRAGLASVGSVRSLRDQHAMLRASHSHGQLLRRQHAGARPSGRVQTGGAAADAAIQRSASHQQLPQPRRGATTASTAAAAPHAATAQLAGVERPEVSFPSVSPASPPPRRGLAGTASPIVVPAGESIRYATTAAVARLQRDGSPPTSSRRSDVEVEADATLRELEQRSKAARTVSFAGFVGYGAGDGASDASSASPVPLRRVGSHRSVGQSDSGLSFRGAAWLKARTRAMLEASAKQARARESMQNRERERRARYLSQREREAAKAPPPDAVHFGGVAMKAANDVGSTLRLTKSWSRFSFPPKPTAKQLVVTGSTAVQAAVRIKRFMRRAQRRKQLVEREAKLRGEGWGDAADETADELHGIKGIDGAASQSAGATLPKLGKLDGRAERDDDDPPRPSQDPALERPMPSGLGFGGAHRVLQEAVDAFSSALDKRRSSVDAAAATQGPTEPKKSGIALRVSTSASPETDEAVGNTPAARDMFGRSITGFRDAALAAVREDPAEYADVAFGSKPGPSNVALPDGVTADDLPEALYWASLRGDMEEVAFLLMHCEKEHIDAYRSPELGWTALIAAVRYRHDDIAQVLLGRGADPDIQTLDEGRSALHEAVALNNIPMTRTLLAHGADPHLQDHFGWDCLLLAAFMEKYDVCRYLIKKIGISASATTMKMRDAERRDRFTALIKRVTMMNAAGSKRPGSTATQGMAAAVTAAVGTAGAAPPPPPSGEGKLDA